MAYSSYQSPRRNRKSIRQKNSLSGSSGASPSPWKDALKAKCLERARAKRIHTMNQKRTAFTSPQNSAFVQNTPGEAYSCNNSDGHHYDASDSAATGINTAVSPKNTARQVVQEQLQATGVRIFPSSAVKENALFPTPTKNTTANMNLSMNSNTNNLMKPRFSPIPQLSTAMFSPSGSNCSLIPQIPSTPMIDYSIHNDNTCNEHNAVANGENWISEDELYELMQEVEEELLLEQEAHLQKELDTMEEEEEMQSNFLQDQIDTYENSNEMMMCTSQEEVSVICPICKLGNLSQSVDHGMICQYYQESNSMETNARTCNFRLSGNNAKQMSLDQLRNRLSQAYQECMGTLHFEVVRNNNNVEDNLAVWCDQSSVKVIIV